MVRAVFAPGLLLLPDTPRSSHSSLQSEVAEGGKASAFVAAPQGLFPAPLPPGRQGSRLLPRFTLLGRAAAKALQDGRMLDVPLSYTFYRSASCRLIHAMAYGHAVRSDHTGPGASLESRLRSCRLCARVNNVQMDRHGTAMRHPRESCVSLRCRIALGHSVDLFDVRKVDAGLGATLEKLAAASGAGGGGGRHSAGPLIIDGVPIEDLCLSFVLPGCGSSRHCWICRSLWFCLDHGISWWEGMLRQAFLFQQIPKKKGEFFGFHKVPYVKPVTSGQARESGH